MTARVLDKARPDYYTAGRELADTAAWMQGTDPAAREARAAEKRWTGDGSTVSLLSSRRKLFDAAAWAGKKLVTDAERARLLLREDVLTPWRARSGGMGRDRVPWRKADLPLLDLPAPHYARAHASDDLAYVDVTSAYYSLYSTVGLDCEYRRDGWVSPGCMYLPRLRELATEKGIRNMVPGICRARVMSVTYGDGDPRQEAVPNPLLAPGLTGWIAECLHAVAGTVLANTDCCYVATDGYIVPGSQAGLVREMLAEWWGLDTHVRARGPGQVLSLGYWRVGADRTAGYARARKLADAGAPLPAPSSGLRRRLSEWGVLRAPTRPAVEPTGNIVALAPVWAAELAATRRWMVAAAPGHRALAGMEQEEPVGTAARALMAAPTPNRPAAVRLAA